jgi:hypothetical protein
LIYGTFILLGSFTVLSAPKILHWSSVALLALGLTAAIVRGLEKYQTPLTIRLRRRWIWLPLLLLMVAGGVAGYERVNEFITHNRLAPVSLAPRDYITGMAAFFSL